MNRPASVILLTIGVPTQCFISFITQRWAVCAWKPLHSAAVVERLEHTQVEAELSKMRMKRLKVADIVGRELVLSDPHFMGHFMDYQGNDGIALHGMWKRIYAQNHWGQLDPIVRIVLGMSKTYGGFEISEGRCTTM